MTAVTVVMPFGYADRLLLSGGQNYRVDKPDQISVIIKVEHSGFCTLDSHIFHSKFVE